MKYKSSIVNYKEIVWADLKVLKKIKKGKIIKNKIEQIDGVVYKEINKKYKDLEVVDVIIKSRLGYENKKIVN
jgi:hypothetical protein